MRFMNDYDVERAEERSADHPVLSAAVQTLKNLIAWTDRNSDGWPYWRPPQQAAQRLIALIEADGTWRGQQDNDPSAADLRRALTPIKAFRTKHKADFKIVEV